MCVSFDIEMLHNCLSFLTTIQEKLMKMYSFHEVYFVEKEIARFNFTFGIHRTRNIGKCRLCCNTRTSVIKEVNTQYGPSIADILKKKLSSMPIILRVEE